jgi:hypothetical protein
MESGALNVGLMTIDNCALRWFLWSVAQQLVILRMPYKRRQKSPPKRRQQINNQPTQRHINRTVKNLTHKLF